MLASGWPCSFRVNIPTYFFIRNRFVLHVGCESKSKLKDNFLCDERVPKVISKQAKLLLRIAYRKIHIRSKILAKILDGTNHATMYLTYLAKLVVQSTLS